MEEEEEEEEGEEERRPQAGCKMREGNAKENRKTNWKLTAK